MRHPHPKHITPQQQAPTVLTPPHTAPLSAPQLPPSHKSGASRNWFPAPADTPAFAAASAANGASHNSNGSLTDALAHLHIATGFADSHDVSLQSGEITPEPSVVYDFSSVIPLGEGPVSDMQTLLPWLTGSVKAQAPMAPVAAAKEESSAPAPREENFDDLMAMLLAP